MGLDPTAWNTPVIAAITQTPVSPTSADAVWVTAQLTDNVSSTRQLMLNCNTGGGWTNVTLFDDGLHQDGAAGDGIYGGQIAAQPSGATVSYYLAASDSLGLTATTPAGAPGTTYWYCGADGRHQCPANHNRRDPYAGRCQIAWASVAGKDYIVLWKATTNAPAWYFLDLVTSSATNTTYMDTSSTQPTGEYGILDVSTDQFVPITSEDAIPATLNLSWTSLPSRTYTVLYGPTLGASSWTTISANQSIGTLTSFSDTNSVRVGQPQGYYRVQLAP